MVVISGPTKITEPPSSRSSRHRRGRAALLAGAQGADGMVAQVQHGTVLHQDLPKLGVSGYHGDLLGGFIINSSEK